MRGLMHDLGQIVYYAEDESLKDIVVLNPRGSPRPSAMCWRIRQRGMQRACSIMRGSRKSWQDRSDGPFHYPAKYHRYFLRLMEKFDISYRIEDDELQQHRRPTRAATSGPRTAMARIKSTSRRKEPEVWHWSARLSPNPAPGLDHRG